MYTGTSTDTDSLLELRFQEGTQATWNVMADDNTLIDCGDPEQVIPCIGPYCMVHPKTGQPIDPLRGFYKYQNPGAFSERLFSVHIPQIINPDIAHSPLKWSLLHRALMRDKKKFIQEKLGIPVEEAAREITLADLKRVCVPDIVPGPDARLEKVRRGQTYKMIVSGIDWGGSDYNQMTKTKVSNTTHAMLGVTFENRVHCLHLRRHGGKDYKTIINLLANDHQRWLGGATGSDFGVGETYHEIMRSHPAFNNGRHIIFHYTGPGSPVCCSMKSNLPRCLNLNRTETITALLVAMTMPEPILLFPSWDEVGDYLEDFLSVHRVLAEKGEHGQRHFVYHRAASKTDDVVHALNFAYSLIRMTYHQLLVSDHEARNLLRDSVLGEVGVAPPTGEMGSGTYSQAIEEYMSGKYVDAGYYEPDYED